MGLTQTATSVKTLSAPAPDPHSKPPSFHHRESSHFPTEYVSWYITTCNRKAQIGFSLLIRKQKFTAQIKLATRYTTQCHKDNKT